jgi:hypothetical protein
MMILGKPLSRRAALRGAGATMALPLLEAMIPSARAMDAQKNVRRLQVMYSPNGMMMENFTPTKAGAEFEITPILKPLEPYREHLTVISNVAHAQAEALGDGSGDHGRSCGTYLTGVHVHKTQGSDLYAGISMDQVVARQLGEHTQIPSLELGLEPPSMVGSCDIGYSCAYTNTLSWSNPTTPLPISINPREVFERLFGDGDSLNAADRKARLQRQASILDYVRESSARLSKKLGASDRKRMDEYLTSVRDFEKRIQRNERNNSGGVALPALARPSGIPDDFVEHSHLMMDLQILAMQADLTRVGTFMIGREVSSRSYPEIGIPDAHHPMSHHGHNPEKVAKLTRINILHVEQTAYFIKRLKETKDGESSLLDSALVMAGASLGDSNQHDHFNLPVVTISGLTPGNRHLVMADRMPITNLMLSVMETVGVREDKFGDSTGRIAGFMA